MAIALRHSRLIPSGMSFVAYLAAVEIGGALDLLNGETDGFAIDATHYDDVTGYAYPAYVGGPVGGTVAVINTGDPTDDLSDVPLDASNLVNSGTSPKMVHWDSSPYVRWTPHNLARQSEDLSDNTVYSTSTAVTATINAGVAPDGTNTASRLQGTASNWSRYQFITIANEAYTQSVWIKSNTGSSQTFELSNVGGGSGDVTATTSWQRFSLSVPSSATGSWHFGIGHDAAGNTVDLLFWGFQVNRGPTATPYIKTTSAARIGIPQGYDTAASKFGILIEPAATNLCLRSDDFTNASWTKSNMSTAKTATGPDGAANSATTLTATNSNATALQAITSGSATRITGMWVKRRTGSGNIDLTQDNGGTWETATVTSDWTRVNLTAASGTNPTVGVRIVTNTDAIDVFGFQHEVGSVLTSTIPTLGSTVTRARDNLTFALSSIPFSTSAGTIGVHFKPFKPVGSTDEAIMYLGTNTNGTPHLVADTANYYSAIYGDGGSVIDAGDWTQNVTNMSRYAFESGNSANKLNALTLATNADAFSPAIASNTTGYLGTNSNTNNLCGLIYRVVYVPRRVTDGDLPTWSFP